MNHLLIAAFLYGSLNIFCTAGGLPFLPMTGYHLVNRLLEQKDQSTPVNYWAGPTNKFYAAEAAVFNAVIYAGNVLKTWSIDTNDTLALRHMLSTDTDKQTILEDLATIDHETLTGLKYRFINNHLALKRTRFGKIKFMLKHLCFLCCCYSACAPGSSPFTLNDYAAMGEPTEDMETILDYLQPTHPLPTQQSTMDRSMHQIHQEDQDARIPLMLRNICGQVISI